MKTQRNRLIAHHAALEMSKGGLNGAIGFLSDPKRLSDQMRKSTAWVDEAIRLIRSALDAPDGTDEEICAMVMQKVAAKKAARKEGSE